MKQNASTTLATSLILFLGMCSPASAYRDYFTQEQKARLAGIQTVYLDAIVLTDKGAGNADGIREVVMRRMGELGYVVTADSGAPHDVLLRVKCEQRKTWEGTASAGGDNDLPDAPSRLWKGPACQLNYDLGGMKVKWQK